MKNVLLLEPSKKGILKISKKKKSTFQLVTLNAKAKSRLKYRTTKCVCVCVSHTHSISEIVYESHLYDIQPKVT